jgi:hypothetical protein
LLALAEAPSSFANDPPMTLQRPGFAPGWARRGVKELVYKRIAQRTAGNALAHVRFYLQNAEKQTPIALVYE